MLLSWHGAVDGWFGLATMLSCPWRWLVGLGRCLVGPRCLLLWVRWGLCLLLLERGNRWLLGLWPTFTTRRQSITPDGWMLRILWSRRSGMRLRNWVRLIRLLRLIAHRRLLRVLGLLGVLNVLLCNPLLMLGRRWIVMYLL